MPLFRVAGRERVEDTLLRSAYNTITPHLRHRQRAVSGLSSFALCPFFKVPASSTRACLLPSARCCAGHLLDHLATLRCYALMAAGDVMHAVCEAIFDKVPSALPAFCCSVCRGATTGAREGRGRRASQGEGGSQATHACVSRACHGGGSDSGRPCPASSVERETDHSEPDEAATVGNHHVLFRVSRDEFGYG